MSFINRTSYKSMLCLPRSQKVTDEELLAFRRFVSGTLIGSEYECKDYCQDYVPFNKEFQPKWKILYAHYQSTKEWPVFEPGVDGPVFYKNGVRCVS
jgi:hypothetical protein